MKFLFSTVCIIVSVLLCQGSPLQTGHELTASEVELIFKVVEAKNFDLLLNLLPLYGHIKLKYLIRKSSYDSLVKFIKNNPKIYNEFKNKLEPVGVFMPDISKINWNVIGQKEWDLVADCVKETNIRDAVNQGEGYLAYLEQYFLVDNKAALDDLIAKAAESGISWNEEIDGDKLGEALLDAFVPNISSFIPTIINIAVWAQSSQLFGR